MRPSHDMFCAVCKKDGASRCTGCKARLYCGKECQRADWPKHKLECQKGNKWYDRYRLCRDGHKHHGKLEIMTWGSPEEETGWGNCLLEECEDLKRKFEVEYEGNPAKFFKYWPQGFRWTCCGTDGAMSWGCDHHGTGPRPCTCDFCQMGKPLPDKIYNKQSPARKGLKLSRGPDPRSRSIGGGAAASVGRAMFGLDL